MAVPMGLFVVMCWLHDEMPAPATLVVYPPVPGSRQGEKNAQRPCANSEGSNCAHIVTTTTSLRPPLDATSGQTQTHKHSHAAPPHGDNFNPTRENGGILVVAWHEKHLLPRHWVTVHQIWVRVVKCQGVLPQRSAWWTRLPDTDGRSLNALLSKRRPRLKQHFCWSHLDSV